jgi:hypothetical protein
MKYMIHRRICVRICYLSCLLKFFVLTNTDDHRAKRATSLLEQAIFAMSHWAKDPLWCAAPSALLRLDTLSYPVPTSEKEEMKPPYVCPGCSNHTYSNNMITRFHVQ